MKTLFSANAVYWLEEPYSFDNVNWFLISFVHIHIDTKSLGRENNNRAAEWLELTQSSI